MPRPAATAAPAPTAHPRRSFRRAHGSQDYWDDLLKLMKRPGATVKGAARTMGSTPETVRRLWLRGDPRFPWGRRPMKAVVEEWARTAAAAERADTETLAAVRRQEQRTPAPTAEQQSAARRDAVQVKTQEAQLVAHSRGQAQVLLHMTTALGKAALVIAKRASEALESSKTITAGEAIAICMRISVAGKRAVETAEAVMRMEREFMGNPSDRLREADVEELGPIDQARAMRELSLAGELYDRMKARGWAILEGGAGGDAPAGAGQPDGPAAVANNPTDLTPPPAPATPEGKPDA